MRLIYSPAFGIEHALALLLACALIAPLVVRLVRGGRYDSINAMALAVAIVAIVAGMVASLEASAGVPYEPCGSCRALWPDSWCSFWFGC